MGTKQRKSNFAPLKGALISQFHIGWESSALVGGMGFGSCIASVWPCGPSPDRISGGNDPRITNTLLDLQLRAPHTSTGPGQHRSLPDACSCLVLKLPSKGAALEVSCRSSPCCKIFLGV